MKATNNDYEDFYIILKDKQGNIVFPKNVETLRIINSIISQRIEKSPTIFCENEQMWFDIDEKQVLESENELTAISLKNVTKYHNNIQDLSIDSVTEIPNRKTTRNNIHTYLESVKDSRESFAIIMADLDDFKKVNDTYGHYIGDLFLKSVAKVLKDNTRQSNDKVKPSDIVGRFGGDEFVVLLKNIDEETALKRLEILREAVNGINISINGNPIHGSTMSFGATIVNQNVFKKLEESQLETDSLISELLRRSDTALYKSKTKGKNQISIYSSNNDKDFQKIIQ